MTSGSTRWSGDGNASMKERVAHPIWSGNGNASMKERVAHPECDERVADPAAVLIVLILAPAVYRSMSEVDKRSEQLAALEKEQLARSEQLAAQEKELLARSEQLAVREKLLAKSDVLQMQTTPAAQLPDPIPEPIELSILCKNELFEHLICADADLAFWPNLVSEIYQHRWRQLDTNGQQILRQDQLDWLRNMRVDCNVPETGTRNTAEMERAKSCVLQSTKERVAVLSNN